MKVLLVVPLSTYPAHAPPLVSGDFPTGFAYIASSLKKAGHHVFGFVPGRDVSTPFTYRTLESELSEKIDLCAPDVVCVGGICEQLKFIRDAINIVRKKIPSAPIICGGGIINHDAEYIFDVLGTDFCVVGEAEEAIVQLLEAIETSTEEFGSIDNIGYRMDGRAVFTKRSYSYPDIDTLPFPDYEPFNFDLLLESSRAFFTRETHRYTRPQNPRPIPLVTARGCPFNCTFCVHNNEVKYRARSVGNILDEIKALYERYQFNILIIIDELFAVNKTRLDEFCTGILAGKDKYGWDFDWFFQTHASVALDRETVKKIKAAGCYFFSYGIESASPSVLKSMNKRTRPEQISEAIKLAQEVEIGFGGNYIFGDPAETLDTFQETLDFVYQHRNNQNFHFSFGRIVPYPESILFEQCWEKGLIRDKSHYYEQRHDLFNMTQIDDGIFSHLMSLLERSGALMGRINLVKTIQAKGTSKLSPPPGSFFACKWSFGEFANLFLSEKDKVRLIHSFIVGRIINKHRLFSVKETCPYCGHSMESMGATELPFDSFMVLTCPSCNGRMQIDIKNVSLGIMGGIIFKVLIPILRFVKWCYLAPLRNKQKVNIIVENNHIKIITG